MQLTFGKLELWTDGKVNMSNLGDRRLSITVSNLGDRRLNISAYTTVGSQFYISLHLVYWFRVDQLRVCIDGHQITHFCAIPLPQVFQWHCFIRCDFHFERLLSDMFSQMRNQFSYRHVLHVPHSHETFSDNLSQVFFFFLLIWL